MSKFYSANVFKLHYPPKRKSIKKSKSPLLVTISDPELACLRDALNFLSDKPAPSSQSCSENETTYLTDYSEWVSIGINLKSLGVVGYEVWDSFSKRFDDYDEAQVLTKWASFKNPVTDYTEILKKAKYHGWAEHVVEEGSDKTNLEAYVFRLSDLDGKPVPKQEYFMPEYIPIGVPAGLYADGGVGKSLVAQQLMTCAASGSEFFGHELKQ